MGELWKEQRPPLEHGHSLAQLEERIQTRMMDSRLLRVFEFLLFTAPKVCSSWHPSIFLGLMGRMLSNLQHYVPDSFLSVSKLGSMPNMGTELMTLRSRVKCSSGKASQAPPSMLLVLILFVPCHGERPCHDTEWPGTDQLWTEG